MNSPRDLLKGLLEYIEEQAKAIDPKGYRLSAAKEFVRRNIDLAGLPGLEFDLRPEGDHIWLHLARLEAHRPPNVPDLFKGLFKVSNDPFGAPPALDEGHLVTWIAQHESRPDSQLAKTHDAKLRQEQLRQKAQAALQEYLAQWKAWAEGERPRRKSISLYGDLFALKHQIEAEETAKPQELVWGVGVACWQIPFGESTVSFEYPLLTQAAEIFIDEKSMALEVRPRATDTRVEMEAFVACSVLGSADVEHAIK
ncbi:MAG: very short patch repair endonuclease, partial [Rhodocyclaceae bacterium]|nr:very short patch repair endonuclease [Rhodocyclaceae bacterium]